MEQCIDHGVELLEFGDHIFYFNLGAGRVKRAFEGEREGSKKRGEECIYDE